MKEKIFVGCGFIDSQLLWLLPLIYGYSKEKKIKSIIFHKRISEKVKNNKIFKKISNHFNVEFLDDHNLLKKYFFIKWLVIILVFLPKGIVLALKTTKIKLLDKNLSWKDSQVYHSIWDTAIKDSEDGVIKPKFINLLIASILVEYNKFEANLALKRNAKHFFIAHSVYGYRAFLSEIRKREINIFCHSGFTIYKQYTNRDNSWCFIDKKLFNKLVKNKSTEVDKYWNKRQKGKGNYEDSRIAANIKNKTKSKYKNIIFLHIFRDSPFADIDRERLFEDYISWIDKTLEILKYSNEDWLLRLHPSYKRWGENQNITLNKIIYRKFNGVLPKNIKIEDNVNSNYEILKNANRIVTFNGTSHLEAACFGIKPIVISNTMLNILKKDFVIKPKTFSQYKKILLRNSESNYFKLKNSDTLLAKKIMYVREKALKFETEVGGFHVFKGDPKFKFLEDYKQTERKLNKNLNFLFKNGQNLSKKINFTLSQSFLNENY
tara:strand:+ start:1406 stop:2878 length:1473 start_codon:yes stop_codon:yes gene_type:complete